MAAKFGNLLLDKQLAMSDVLVAVQSQALSGPGVQASIHQLLGSTRRKMNGNIRDLLDAADCQQFRSYERTAGLQPHRRKAFKLSSDPLFISGHVECITGGKAFVPHLSGAYEVLYDAFNERQYPSPWTTWRPAKATEPTSCS